MNSCWAPSSEIISVASCGDTSKKKHSSSFTEQKALPPPPLPPQSPPQLPPQLPPQYHDDTVPKPSQEIARYTAIALMNKIGEKELVRSILDNLYHLNKIATLTRIQQAHDAILATRVLTEDTLLGERQLRHGRARMREIVGYMEFYAEDSAIQECAVTVLCQLCTTEAWNNLKLCFVQCRGVAALIEAMTVYTHGQPYFTVLKSLEIPGDVTWNAKVEDYVFRAGGIGEIVQPLCLDDIESMAVGVDLLKDLMEWSRPNFMTAERKDVHEKLRRHLPTLESFVRRGRDRERRRQAAMRVEEIQHGLAEIDALYD